MKFLKINKKITVKLMQFVSICCAFLLFIAVLPNPLKYYSVLRMIISIGAILVILKNIANGYWVVLFGAILILFNPIVPIHFYTKVPWVPIDIASGILFLIEIILDRPKKTKPLLVEQEVKTYERDRIL